MKTNALLTVQETTALIEAGRILSLAGDASLLAQLPRGNWIAGTIPYFVAGDGGVESREKIFAVDLTAGEPAQVDIRSYSVNTIGQIARNAPANGYTILILPAGSAIHTEYANHSRDYEDMFLKPIAGWVAGCHLGDIGKVAPAVFNGATGEARTREAVALHVTLPKNQMAVIHILNLFKQDAGGDVITFPETGFSVTSCRVNGAEMRFADYIAASQLNTTLPLVADYNGAQINTSFQKVDREAGSVSFYAPVFAGIEYRRAAAVGNYTREFDALAQGNHTDARFCCNCVLNYLYCELQGRKTGDLCGPLTFGEIGYQLLNQTLVYLDVQTLD